HATAPVELLTRMLTLRVHLDDCPADAGPLRVLPGTHRHGRLGDDAIDAMAARVAEHACVATRGDVLAFSPLLLHASSSTSAAIAHRRVLQLELSADTLPEGLDWRWRV